MDATRSIHTKKNTIHSLHRPHWRRLTLRNTVMIFVVDITVMYHFPMEVPIIGAHVNYHIQMRLTVYPWGGKTTSLETPIAHGSFRSQQGEPSAESDPHDASNNAITQPKPTYIKFSEPLSSTIKENFAARIGRPLEGSFLI